MDRCVMKSTELGTEGLETCLQFYNYRVAVGVSVRIILLRPYSAIRLILASSPSPNIIVL